MLKLFLQAATEFDDSFLGYNTEPGVYEDLMSVLWPIIGLVILMFLVIVAIYIYYSLAHRKIAQKIGKTSPAGIAWIPYLGPLIIRWHATENHWWPWLIIPAVYLVYILMAVLALFSLMWSTIFLVLTVILFLVLFVFTVIWEWKMFKALGRPGWWALVPVIGGLLYFISWIIGAFVHIAAIAVGVVIGILTGIIYLVLVGIAAWGSTTVQSKTKISVKRA